MCPICSAGEGEFGVVHKAMWCGTLVAAKTLKDSTAIALGDFRSEIAVLQRVHHPNAVQVGLKDALIWAGLSALADHTG